MIRAFAAVALFLMYAAPCSAGLSPNQLKAVVLAPLPGATLPVGEEFISSAGRERVTLEEAIGGKPTALVLADYRCRFTCGTALAITAAGLSQTGLVAGRDYNFLVIGINPKESPADAEAMKAAYLEPYPAIRSAAKFLLGSDASTARVTQALNYQPAYDAERDEFAHPLGVVILTGAGRVSRVIGGLSLDAAALKAALADAGQSKLSALIEGIRLLCYGHSPLQGAYASTIQTAIEASGVLTLLGIGGAFAFLALRKRSQS